MDSQLCTTINEGATIGGGVSLSSLFQFMENTTKKVDTSRLPCIKCHTNILPPGVDFDFNEDKLTTFCPRCLTIQEFVRVPFSSREVSAGELLSTTDMTTLASIKACFDICLQHKRSVVAVRKN